MFDHRQYMRYFISDIMYGASDGIVTTFAIVSGVVGAALSPVVIIIIGFVSLLADGFSMGAARYLSMRASHEMYGEHDEYREAIVHGVATFIAFVVFGSMPLIGFLIPQLAQLPFLTSCIFTAGALVVVGWIRGRVTLVNPFRTSLETLLVGAAAALVAFGVGKLLGHWFLHGPRV